MMAGQAILDVYIYMGEHDVVPRYVTRVRVHESVKAIQRDAFKQRRNLVEFECHDGVETIGKFAFYGCPSLRRVIIPGVTAIDEYAFSYCKALTDVVDCDKLERIGKWAFDGCKSLRSITLPSIEIVENWAFSMCKNLTDVTFGNKLESIGPGAFYYCPDLRRITIPLKDGMITDDDVFQKCKALKCVDLLVRIHKTISALQLEDWRKDMNIKIRRANQVLPTAYTIFLPGGKAREIGFWIQSVLRKMEHYKAEHRTLLKEAATILELALWKSRLCGDNNDVLEGDGKKRAECRNDCGADMSIIIPNVLSFLKIE